MYRLFHVVVVRRCPPCWLFAPSAQTCSQSVSLHVAAMLLSGLPPADGNARTLTVLDPSVHYDTNETHAWLKLAMLQPLMLLAWEAHDCAARCVMVLTCFIFTVRGTAPVWVLAVWHSRRCNLYCGVAQCVGLHSQQ